LAVNGIVNTEPFMQWFRTATWDANGDPVGTSSCLEPIPSASPAQPMPSRTGSTTCPEDEANVPAETHWYYVGTSSSGCTTPRKCEYYSPSTPIKTDYITLGGVKDYGQADITKSKVYVNLFSTGVSSYVSKFRVFIPPGTVSASMLIFDYGKQAAIARQKIPPVNTTIPSVVTNNPNVTLDDYIAADQVRFESIEGKISVIDEQFTTPVTLDQAGWFYVYVAGGSTVPNYLNQFSLAVNPEIYNNWYNHQGANSNGSINWATEIEGVVTYVPYTGSHSCLEPIPPASPAQPMPSRIGATICPEDEADVPAETHWYYIGTSSSGCTTPRKCEYYTPGTNCDLTANLYAVPSTGSAPFIAYINASINTSHGPIQCSNQDCNGGTISYPYANEKCIFNCTYTTAGTYNPKVHVTDTVCAKDPTTRVVVNIAGTPDCDTNTCAGNSCWNGPKYIPGIKTENCAT
jgi:hypothetical protein